jgi:hypothetical protein
MFLFRTGLLMEEWGSEIVIRERLGFVAESLAEMIANLAGVNPNLLRARQRQPIIVTSSSC